MPKVLLIGWDGAGWSGIHPLLDSGAMPNLARLVENGVMGPLGTLTPLCSPLLWTSVATGQFADRHGVLDALEPDPRTGGVRPITRASLRAPQVWDILAGEGVPCQAVGWPATHPCVGPATCVSGGFPHGVPQSIYPESLEAAVAPLRFKPDEWTGDDLRLFVPELSRIDQDKDKRLARLAVILAEAISVHGAATWLMENGRADFTAVWYGALGQAWEMLSGAGPEGRGEAAPAIYDEVLPGVYRFLDLLLGRLVALAGPDAVVMLASDRTAGEGRGMLCAAGPGIAKDELAFGAGLLDIAPTVMGLFGYAPAPGMPGRAIAEICPLPGEKQARAVAPQRPPDDAEAELEVAELEALGYTDPVEAAARPQAEWVRGRRTLHLAMVLMSQGRASEAVPGLEALRARFPQEALVKIQLGHAYFQAGRHEECRALCDELIEQSPDSPLVPLARAHLAIAAGNYQEAERELRKSRKADGVTAALDTAVGEAYLAMGRWEEAAGAFRSAIAADAETARGLLGLARAHLAGQRFGEAAEAALDAIRVRYDVAAAHRVLGLALEKLNRREDAARAFAASERLSGRA